MKKIILILITFVITFTISAQDESDFDRKGTILLETGYGVVGGYSGGSGISVIKIGDS